MQHQRNVNLRLNFQADKHSKVPFTKHERKEQIGNINGSKGNIEDYAMIILSSPNERECGAFCTVAQQGSPTRPILFGWDMTPFIDIATDRVPD